MDGFAATAAAIASNTSEGGWSPAGPGRVGGEHSFTIVTDPIGYSTIRHVVPTFLGLPDPPEKPRSGGVTHVLDKGLTLRETLGRVESRGDLIDVWKFGWGTAYVEPRLADKLALLREHDVVALPRRHDHGDRLGAAAPSRSASPGLAAPGSARSRCRAAPSTCPSPTSARSSPAPAPHFTVLAETGYKSADRLLSAQEWADEVRGDLRAGATFAVTEGRESGTVGLYDSGGRPLEDIINAVVEAAGIERAIFEAPTKAQQSWFVNRFGPLVNLGNVASADVLGLRTLRLGLRSDTLGISVGELTSTRT